MKLNLDFLLETLWEYLSLIRVYTKKPGQPPDFEDGLILRKVYFQYLFLSMIFLLN